MIYEFEIANNATEATKNICYAKDEGTVEYSTDVRWFKKLKATDLDYKAKEATKNICYEKRWRYSWI